MSKCKLSFVPILLYDYVASKQKTSFAATWLLRFCRSHLGMLLAPCVEGLSQTQKMLNICPMKTLRGGEVHLTATSVQW